MPTSLRDLLTGAIPGNVLNQIPLGDANDPQFNKFTYNIFGQLGPSPGVNTGAPTIFGGPFGGSVGGQQQQQQAPSQSKFDKWAMTGVGTPGGSFNNPPIGSTRGLIGSYGHPPGGSTAGLAGRPGPIQSFQTPGFGGFGQPQGDPGATLRNRMISWKF